MSVNSKLDAGNVEAVFDLFRKRHKLTVDEVSKALSIKPNVVNAAIKKLLDSGVLLAERGDYWELDKAPKVGATKDFVFTSDAKGQYKFGLYSDQHICSKYSRLDVGEDLFDKFTAAGIKTVFNAGNYIDGERKFNKHDLLVHGVDNQCRELAKIYPKRQGIKTYAVSGDDHEGWYSQDFGIDIGDRAEELMIKAGRKDWVNLGYMEAFVTLRHRESGAESKMLIMHPGGGSAYAMSYKPQKIVESFAGGEKPAVLLIGHYHKISFNLIRSVWALQIGCGQDQTPFMRKKGLDAHVGGGTVTLTQDPRTGAIIGCAPEFWQYFVQSYYNNRWSHSGDVTLAERKYNG